MEKVPAIISTKDLSYICDMFNWNFTAAKKALCYSKEVSDMEISNELEKVYKMHKQIATELINILG